jgi:hypothetical protein
VLQQASWSCARRQKRAVDVDRGAIQRSLIRVPPPRAWCCPLRCRSGRDTASDPPPLPCSPRRKSSSRWKLIAPFYLLKFFSCPNPLMLSVFCVMNVTTHPGKYCTIAKTNPLW